MSAAGPPAGAQTPSTYDPIQYGLALIQAPGVAYAANVVMLRILTGSSCDDRNCSAPGIPDPFVASLNYFADLRRCIKCAAPSIWCLCLP